MLRRGFCVWCAAAALLVGLPARAQNEGGMDAREGYARTGVYAGLAGAVAFDDFSSNVLGNIAGIPPGFEIGNFDPSLGLHVRGGYRFLEWIAGEVHLEWLSGFDGSAGTGQASTSSFDIWTLALTTDLKLYAPFGRFQPFLTLGAGALSATFPNAFSSDKSEWDFAGRLGGGIDIYVTQNIALNFDATYVLPVETLTGLNYTSVGWGFLYRF